MEKDPYRYFRIEAREILDVLSRGILELETSAGAPGVPLDVQPLLRASHTLKGAAGVVGHERIAKLAHRLEELLAARLGPGAETAAPTAEALLAIVDEIAMELSKLVAPATTMAAPAPGPTPSGSPSAPAESVRLDLLDVDAVLASVGDVSVRLASAHLRASGLGRLETLVRNVERWLDETRGVASHSPVQWDAGAEMIEHLRGELRAEREALGELLEGAARRAQDALDDARRLRLIPAETLFAELARAVRDAATGAGLRVELETSGGSIRLDAHVLGLLRDGLLQLVRNAIAHAIEPAPERRRAGKPDAGRIFVRFELHGPRARVTCRDDGRGLDLPGMRRALVERGGVSAADVERMDVNELVGAVMRRGVTTRASATELAGRGVGLQLVRSVIDRLRGEVEVRTEAGVGTEIQLDVPVSITAAPALVVEAGDVTATIPLDAVTRTVRGNASDVTASPAGDILSDGGEALPFASLARALGRSPQVEGEPASLTAVLLDAGGARAAVSVDRIVLVSSDVVLPLPAAAVADPVVVGASVDAEGHARLALDPRVLVERVSLLPGAPRRAVAEEKKAILVVDDSLTSRMLERSILEAAGYDVTTASSGEEGLELARQRPFALFVVDVEMPGISGFEFVARTRADAILSNVPAMLVTSRSAPEDRRRGHEVGARAYIVKGELAQDELLDSVRRLIG